MYVTMCMCMYMYSMSVVGSDPDATPSDPEASPLVVCAPPLHVGESSPLPVSRSPDLYLRLRDEGDFG